jgi:3-(3-hydroxy-phenyl)propionate hydroxylase
MPAPQYDVAIIGYGPTGLTLASLLGQRNLRVVVIEKWSSLYGLARLTHIDGETARLLSFACDLDEALRDSSPIKSYVFYNAKGRELVDVASAPSLPMAHPPHISIHQPDIEHAIDHRVRTLPSVLIRQGFEATSLKIISDSRVEISIRSGEIVEAVSARFVFGADGARSFVRSALGIERTDFGFNERWLNIDGDRKRELPSDFEATKQYCDPARGHMYMPIGTGRQRFEFALLPGENTEEMSKPESAWKLLSKYHDVGPEDLSITRHIVYTFECRLAQTWRKGPALIGGDAAHTMPPYLGQGACSGIRDAANIAWKLDLVLSGKASPALLDTYEVERKPQVTNIMKTALMLGKVANTRNRAIAFIRDLAFRFKLVPPPPPFAAFTDGVVQGDRSGKAAKMLGSVPPQGFVEVNGRRQRFDEVVGYHFALLARSNPVESLSSHQLSFLVDLDCRIYTLAEDASTEASRLLDSDGVYGSFLRETGAFAMLTRPDTNLFGVAQSTTQLGSLVEELKRKLHWLPRPSATPAAAISQLKDASC